MFERLQKPFLTVETGEAYQPIRLSYQLTKKEKLVEKLNSLGCCQKNTGDSWNWFWRDECDDLHFESLENFKRNPNHPLRIGTLMIRDQVLYINLPSFKRACLAVPFFHKLLDHDTLKIEKADFINKVFGIDERLPHGFSELFKEEELETLIEQRIHDYEEVQRKAEEAKSAEEALAIISQYTRSETQKRLPYAERYSFHYENTHAESDVMFLGFYIFLRGRELVAIRRWFGETGYNLASVADDTLQNVFGNMDIDILD